MFQLGYVIRFSSKNQLHSGFSGTVKFTLRFMLNQLEHMVLVQQNVLYFNNISYQGTQIRKETRGFLVC